MAKVRVLVNLIDENMQCVTLHPGDEIPDWAISRFKNPDVLDLGVEAPTGVDNSTEIDGGESKETEDTTHDYTYLDKNSLVALAKHRGLSAAGSKADIAARLAEADAADEKVEELDVWSLDVDELKALAADRGIDVGEASTQVELATIIHSAVEA